MSREANFVAVGLTHRPTGLVGKLARARALYGREVHLREVGGTCEVWRMGRNGVEVVASAPSWVELFKERA